jgi:hypothetical protein
MRWLSGAECSVTSLSDKCCEQHAAQQSVVADHQQLVSIDLGCCLAAN